MKGAEIMGMHVRIRVQTSDARWVSVGPFGTLGGARRLAEDLITQASVRAVRVEHRQPHGGWKPAWSYWTGLLGLLLLTVTGCATAGGLTPVTREQGIRLAEAQQLTEQAWATFGAAGPAPEVRMGGIVGRDGGGYFPREHRIVLHPTVLETDRTHLLLWQPMLGHEIGHALRRDRPGCGTACEQEADRAALRILTEAWGVPRDRAAFEVCTMATLRAFGQAVEHRPMPGHDAVREAEVFRREHHLAGSCEPEREGTR